MYGQSGFQSVRWLLIDQGLGVSEKVFSQDKTKHQDAIYIGEMNGFLGVVTQRHCRVTCKLIFNHKSRTRKFWVKGKRLGDLENPALDST